MSELTPCPECQRHVRKNEARCPFCGEALSLSHLPSPALPTRRLGRAATFAFGAGIVGATALVSCGGQDESHGVLPVPLYGGPPSGSGGMSYGGGPVYGAPPSGSSNGGNPTQGGTNDVGGAQPVYGAPAAGTGNEPMGGQGGQGGVTGAAGHDDAGAGVYGAPPGGDSGFGGAQPVYGGPPGSGAGGV